MFRILLQLSLVVLLVGGVKVGGFVRGVRVKTRRLLSVVRRVRRWLSSIRLSVLYVGLSVSVRRRHVELKGSASLRLVKRRRCSVSVRRRHVELKGSASLSRNVWRALRRLKYVSSVWKSVGGLRRLIKLRGKRLLKSAVLLESKTVSWR